MPPAPTNPDRMFFIYTKMSEGSQSNVYIRTARTWCVPESLQPPLSPPRRSLPSHPRITRSERSPTGGFRSVFHRRPAAEKRRRILLSARVFSDISFFRHDWFSRFGRCLVFAKSGAMSRRFCDIIGVCAIFTALFIYRVVGMSPLFSDCRAKSGDNRFVCMNFFFFL